MPGFRIRKDSAEHRQLARSAEREAIVLLKNQDGFLPLKSSVRKVAKSARRRTIRWIAGELQRHFLPAGDSARRGHAAVLLGQGRVRPGRDLYRHTQSLVSSNVLTPPDRNGQGAGRVLQQFRFSGTTEAPPEGASGLLRRRHEPSTRQYPRENWCSLRLAARNPSDPRRPLHPVNPDDPVNMLNNAEFHLPRRVCSDE